MERTSLGPHLDWVLLESRAGGGVMYTLYMPGVGHRTASVSVLKLKGLECSCRILYGQRCVSVYPWPLIMAEESFP